MAGDRPNELYLVLSVCCWSFKEEDFLVLKEGIKSILEDVSEAQKVLKKKINISLFSLNDEFSSVTPLTDDARRIENSLEDSIKFEDLKEETEILVLFCNENDGESTKKVLENLRNKFKIFVFAYCYDEDRISRLEMLKSDVNNFILMTNKKDWNEVFNSILPYLPPPPCLIADYYDTHSIEIKFTIPKEKLCKCFEVQLLGSNGKWKEFATIEDMTFWFEPEGYPPGQQHKIRARTIYKLKCSGIKEDTINTQWSTILTQRLLLEKYSYPTPTKETDQRFSYFSSKNDDMRKDIIDRISKWQKKGNVLLLGSIGSGKSSLGNAIFNTLNKNKNELTLFPMGGGEKNSFTKSFTSTDVKETRKLVFWDSPGIEKGVSNYSRTHLNCLLNGYLKENIKESDLGTGSPSDSEREVQVVILVIQPKELKNKESLENIRKIKELISQDVLILVVINKIDTIEGLNLMNVGPRALNCNKIEQLLYILDSEAKISNQYIQPCVSYCKEFHYDGGKNEFISFLILSLIQKAVDLVDSAFLIRNRQTS